MSRACARLAAGILLAGTQAAAPASLDLVKDGVPVATVVVPAATNALTRQAADYLVRYVRQITGAKLEMVNEDDPRARQGPRVLLGATRAAAAAGLDLAALKADGFFWKVQDDTLFIAGRDVMFPGEKNPTAYSACRGTATGVLRLLEDFGGVRWLLPSPKGEWVPKASGFSVPADLARREEPTFEYVDPRFSRMEHRVWSFANGFRISRKIKMFGGHSWEPAVEAIYGDVEELFKKEPERFAVINGRRGGDRTHKHQRLQLCSSHPDYVPMNVKFLQGLFDQGYEWVEFGASDGWYPCECERCQAMDEIGKAKTPRKFYDAESWEQPLTLDQMPAAERLWLPFLEIATQLAKSHPQHRVMPIVYGPVKIPSRRIREFPPNIVWELASQSESAFAGFQGPKTVYVYWWGTYHTPGLSPKCKADYIVKQVRYLAEKGTIGIYPCGGAELFGLEGPIYYLFAKLAWDPTRDPEAVLGDYYRGVYRGAAAEARAFLDALTERIAVGRAAEKGVKERERVGTYFAAAFPPEVLADLDRRLAAAQAAAQGDEVATGWLGLTERQYRYLKLLANGFTLYQEYRKGKEPALRARLEDAVAAWRAHVAELEAMKADKDYLKDWFPGWQAYLEAAPSNGRMHAQVDDRPPFDGKF